MFSARNIHYAILGIILGASAGYILAFYQAQSAAPPPISQPAPSAGLPPGHPAINNEGANEQSLDELKKAVEQSPKNPELLARYGMRLFTSGQANQGIESYEKILTLQPNNLTVRSLLVGMLFSQGRTPEAKKHLAIAVKQNPNYLPTLHGLFLVTLEGDHDVKKAAEILQTIEKLQPSYQGLPDLRSRLEAARKAQK